ncbi:MAG: DUF6065 family protein [Gemmataceae bacterium]
MNIEFLRPDRTLNRTQAQPESYDDWDNIAAPFPASQGVPLWMREMTAEAPSGKQTVKRCPPFLESMTCGYLIPFPDWAEIRLREIHEWDKRGPGIPFLGFHTKDQFAGSWFENYSVVKFDSPWIIRTPPGYSTLFVPPLNCLNYPFYALSGLVETDTYYNNIAFPLLLLDSTPGVVHRVEKGTPLVQAIPIKRDDWEMSTGETDWEQWCVQKEMVLSGEKNVYRNNWYVKKKYQ